MTKYALLGGGRLARHFSLYFQSLRIPHTRWVRDRSSPFNSFDVTDAELRLKQAISGADFVLLLVSDHAIEDLLGQYPFLRDQRLVHCSGSLSIEGVAGVHPLMTFADVEYEPRVYRSIPFIVEQGYDFKEIFPALPNPHHAIDVDDKARYHAMCVMAGNFVQVMWAAITDQFVQRFEWPHDTLHPYLKQVTDNFIQQPESALTGPLVRNDLQTIERNIQSLENDPLQDIYRSFVRFHQGQKNLKRASRPERLEKVI